MQKGEGSARRCAIGMKKITAEQKMKGTEETALIYREENRERPHLA